LNTLLITIIYYTATVNKEKEKAGKPPADKETNETADPQDSMQGYVSSVMQHIEGNAAKNDQE